VCEFGGLPRVELRNVSLKLRNVRFELRNVSLELRNVRLELRHVVLELRNVGLELRHVSLNVPVQYLREKDVPELSLDQARDACLLLYHPRGTTVSAVLQQ
jgi:hypothetical protein